MGRKNSTRESKINERVLKYPKRFENLRGELWCKDCNKEVTFTDSHGKLNLKHITCIVHLLHNVCERIRYDNDEINSLI
jgi:hypothetical protein